MKILFIANRFPYPPFRGDKLKIYNLCKRISARHELHLICFTEQQSDLQYLKELEPVFKSISTVHLPKWQSLFNSLLGLFRKEPLQVSYFRSARFSRVLHQLIRNNHYDAVHVQHLRMARYAIPYTHLYRILDFPDAFSLYWERRKQIRRSFFAGLLDRIESSRVTTYEKYLLGRFNLNLVCSEEDRLHLLKLHGNTNIRLLPNGVDTDQFRAGGHSYAHNKTLLFTGNMDYDPNVDAVLYFVREIFPVISKQFPETVFVIAGQRPVDKVKALDNGSSIRVTGFIPDLSEMYNKASVVVAPLRFGAGTQNKVLEAMAMGIPVVCSNIGFAGLGIVSGEGAFMQTDAASFAGQVCQLLGNETLRETTGKKGVEVIRRSFSWDTVAAQLESYLEANW